MTKLKPTPELLESVITRVPEGFIHLSVLSRRVRTKDKSARAITQAIEQHMVARTAECLYDPSRLTLEETRALAKWAKPDFPHMLDDGTLPQDPIVQQLERRQQQIDTSGQPVFVNLFARLAESPGYVPYGELATDEDSEEAIAQLVNAGVLRQLEELVYDPLRLSQSTMEKVHHRYALLPFREQLVQVLRARPGATAPRSELEEIFGKDMLNTLLNTSGFATFTVPLKVTPHKAVWVRLGDTDAQQAHHAAKEATRIKDEHWAEARTVCGETLRPDAQDGETLRAQVISRSYIVKNAAKRLDLHVETVQEALARGLLRAFVDPEETLRLPAEAVEAAVADAEQHECLAAFEVLKARELALVSGLHYNTIRRRLRKGSAARMEPYWEQVRGKWGLPRTLREFREKLRQKLDERRALLEAERERLRLQLEEEQRRRNELRDQLVAAFPAWRHADRVEQRLYLHVGPPNSGKTHHALEALTQAGSGWYLAPLRLLAFEIFDRLNQRGVFCNLLTGEEYIPIPGATITAATIEMFNNTEHNECVIIDEAQMLADPDRGWAWTRAMMESTAPEIHIIGPATSRTLIETMAKVATIPIEVIEHERLAPIRVSDQHYPLSELPASTILVAFSRRMVLYLKNELERMKRTVSVVYGNLPPEVRRKQAERFASGQTEICIATDAVGMGLNLPAHYVVFYETSKYDGRAVRPLLPEEVQQIGGRAGRFGFSEYGEVSATTKHDLRVIRGLFNAEPRQLTHARVAPSVEDLQMIPGSLRDKLVQWAALESIPDELRGVIQTADMTERVELAGMLSDQDVQQLGLAGAVKLTNAPTRQSSRQFWQQCARAILSHQPMPLPPPAPKIVTSHDLEQTETCISCADIYLWLSQRRDFGIYGPDEQVVRAMRAMWSMAIDDALLRKIDTGKRCTQCGAPLSIRYRFNICERCYHQRFMEYDAFNSDE